MTQAEEKCKTPSSKPTRRKQKLKDLMRNRTTIERSLTFSQIFCEVYPDVVEKYSRKDRDFGGKSQLQVFDGDIIHVIMLQSDYADYYKIAYLRRLIKQVRKTDDEFRWLSVLPPIKRNETYSDKYGNSIKNKVRPYVEYKYLNIKASQTPELLEETNRYWRKRKLVIRQGLEDMNKRLRGIAEMMSTPEGQREYETGRAVVLEENEFIQFYLDNRDTAQINKIIDELKQEGRLPKQYKPNYDNISEILKREIANSTALAHMMRQMPDVILYDDDKRKREIRKAVKDLIASFSDIRQFEKE
jgi:hypothetical protein